MSSIKTVGIDLGSKITVYVEGEGIVMREPSCIALDSNSMESVAFGSEALSLNSRMPGCFNIVDTVFEGRITDYEKIAELISALFASNSLLKNDILFAISSEINEAEARALCDLLESAKARSIGFVDIPTTCILGSNEELSDERAVISVNIGSGLTEIGLVKGCVTKFVHTVKYGCGRFDTAITNYLKRKESVNISPETAKMIRETLGSVHSSANFEPIDVRGFDTVTGLPLTIEVTTADTCEALIPIVDYIIKCVEALVKALPATIKADIVARGIILSGGGALTGGMEELFTERLNLPVKVSPNALDCCIEGLGLIIENKDIFADLIKDPMDYVESRQKK